MISFFPDLNVWLALSVGSHAHSPESWRWLNSLSREAQLVFSRYTHMGLLRLLTTPAVMGELTQTLAAAWDTYDRWMADPRVEFHGEPRGLESVFREMTEPFRERAAAKWIGDCYLLTYAAECRATLVTFDQALVNHAHSLGHRAIIPG